MKKVFIILLALVTLQVSAQEKKRELQKEGQRERGEMMKDLSPEETATLQTKKMTLHLDLSEAQQKQMKALNLEQASLRKAKMEEVKKLKESGEKPSKEARLKMMNEKLDHQIALKAKMKSILNAEQFTKWESSQAKMQGKRQQGKEKMMRNRVKEQKDKQ
jgi:hypothetical protein